MTYLARLILSVAFCSFLAATSANGQNLLGGLTGNSGPVSVDRSDGNTDVSVGGGDSLLDFGYGTGGESGSVMIGDGMPDLGGLGIPALASLGGTETGSGVDVTIGSTGGGTTGGGLDPLLALARLISGGACQIAAPAGDVVVVRLEEVIGAGRMGDLSSLLIEHAGDIAACQAALARSASLLGLSSGDLRRVVAVEAVAGNRLVVYVV